MGIWRASRTPVPPHPFSNSISGDGWVFITGVGGHDASGGIADDAEAQARAAIGTITHLLEEAGSSLSEVVYFRPYVTSLDHVAAMNEVLEALLPHPRPASGALLVAGLADPRMKVEFEAWAQSGAILTES